MCAERKLLPIEIFTDGSSRGNPGPGGYGVILRCGEHYKELSEGFAQTTNNRMELTAVIVGLEAVKRPDAEIILYSDSKYVVDSVNKGWVFGWERKNFEKRLNADLWIRFLAVYRRHRVRFVWVKGHADNPMNNRCDQLAVAAATAVIKASGGKTPEPPPASAG
ncbi:MAG TPA: ribonuclease HI [Candidatus Coprenecus avistercoris]|uniref:ribonuclease H n=1 Tax=Candidatus Coprenecus avistercoris TaxID=2840730 RepID=A0A9D1E080_9BACT|nr:ribonuclease HI [Candidatus Coprenecus avistercoris]